MARWLVQAALAFIIAFVVLGVDNADASDCPGGDKDGSDVCSSNAREAQKTADGLATLGAAALIQAALSKSKLQQDIEESILQTRDETPSLQQIAVQTELQTPGDTATLDDAGYQSLVAHCCPEEVSKWIARVVVSLGKIVCTEGGLNGLAEWYKGCEGAAPRDYASLLTDIQAGTTGDCPWVGDPNPVPTGTCPPRPNCPVFPNDRRRRCTNAVACTPAMDIDLGNDCDGSNGGAGKLQVNNLDGVGPLTGKQEIRYRNVGVLNGQSFDLVVKALTRVTRFLATTEADGGYSGCQGAFGKISIQAGTTVDLAFAFETANSLPVTLPNLLFSVYDIDGGSNSGEEVDVPSADKYYLKPDVTNVIDKGQNVFSACAPDVDCKYYPGVTYPCPWDRVTCPSNWPQPTSPSTLDDLQKAGAVQFEFSVPLSSFTLRWGRLIGAKTWSSRMFFAGASNLVTKCPSRL